MNTERGLMEQGRRLWRRIAWLLLGLLGMGAAAPAMAACGAPATQNDPLGSYSAATVKAGASGFIQVLGGFTCTSGNILTLLGANYLRATVSSTAVLELPSTTLSATSGKPIATIPYTLAAAGAGTPVLKPGTTVYFINGTALNLLGLLGNNGINVPIFIKPQSTAQVPPGDYVGTVKIKWEWHFCPVLEVLGSCVLGADEGTGDTTITFTMTVGPKPATVSISSVTTWDPVSFANYPRAIPGSKARLTMTVANPDLVPLDTDQMVVVMPTPANLAVALDGDGTAQTDVVRTAQGSTSSTLSLTYGGAGVAGDDVEFSMYASGDDFTYQPVAGDTATQGAVKRVRFKTHGAMAPQSSYSISLPYLVK